MGLVDSVALKAGNLTFENKSISLPQFAVKNYTLVELNNRTSVQVGYLHRDRSYA